MPFSRHSFIRCSLLLQFTCLGALSSATAGPSINGDPFLDELLTNACVAQSPYWSEVKALLASGRVDEAVERCRRVMARRSLDIDTTCIYAMALEMKLRGQEYDPAVFDECVREWTHVAKAKILSQSSGWDHVGEGEVFSQNQERRAMANRHLKNLVGRAPGYLESEESFLKKAIKTSASVSARLKGKDSEQR